MNWTTNLTFCGGTVLAGIGGMFSASSGLVVEVPSDVAGWLEEAAASLLQRN